MMPGNFFIPLLKGIYPYFSIVAFAVIVHRIRKKLWTPAETILLLIYVVSTLLPILQIMIADNKVEFSQRYLLPSAPLLFGWAAYGVFMVYERYKGKYVRQLCVLGAILALALLLDGWGATMKFYTSRRMRVERIVTDTAATFIRGHYTGPKLDSPTRNLDVYHSPFRPVVWNGKKFPFIGAAAGGRPEPSAFNDKPDYWVLPAAASPAGKELHRFTALGEEYVIYGR